MVDGELRPTCGGGVAAFVAASNPDSRPGRGPACDADRARTRNSASATASNLLMVAYEDGLVGRLP